MEWSGGAPHLGAAKEDQALQVGAGISEHAQPGLRHAAAPRHIQLLQAVPAPGQPHCHFPSRPQRLCAQIFDSAAPQQSECGGLLLKPDGVELG